MHSISSILAVIAFALLASALAPAAPKPLTIKLGTLVPVDTSYDKTLKVMRGAWSHDSGGTVDLKIYAGGKAGGEAAMVGLMMADSLQAAMLTAVGLTEIERGVTGLQNLPMGFRDFNEVDEVGEMLRPMLEERLAKKGFVVLFWTDAGWVRFFSNQPVASPDDLRRLTLFTWAGNPEQVAIMKSAGFNPRPLETADIMPSLQTGNIDAVPMPPFFALAGQIDGPAPYMLEVNWAPLVGACVIRTQTWEKIPGEVRARLLVSAARAGREARADGRRESDESVAAMVKRGLKVTHLTPEGEAEWRRIAESLYPEIRGTLVPADVFDRTLACLSEVRACGPAAP